MSIIEEIRERVKNYDFSRLSVAFVYGGNYEESSVSMLSLPSYQDIAKKIGFKEVNFINCDSELITNLQKIKPDIVFNAMYGEFGEDGGLPAVCKFLGLRYTHSGVMTSSMSMNKNLSKKLYGLAGIPVAKSVICKKSDLNIEYLSRIFDIIGSDKLVVKPNCGGSSIGISIISRGDIDVSESLKSRDSEFLIEEFIAGNDFCTLVLLGESVGVIELEPKSGFYDYENKYMDGKTEHFYPARLPKDIYEKMMIYAQKAYEITECKTLCRFDFRFDGERMSMSEGNTHPGMTKNSLVPEIAFKEKKMSFAEIVKIIIYDTLQ